MYNINQNAFEKALEKEGDDDEDDVRITNLDTLVFSQKYANTILYY